MKSMVQYNVYALLGCLSVACGGTASSEAESLAHASGTQQAELTTAAAARAEHKNWLQWGQNGEHQGNLNVKGQPFTRELVNYVYDPLVPEEQAANQGALLAHFQVPLVEGKDVYMMEKAGTYDPTNFATQVWSETKFSWVGDSLVKQWSYVSDWTPPGSTRDFWEPVFHPVVTADALYVPGKGGTLWKVDKQTGQAILRINPFGSSIDENKFLLSPVTADRDGNLFFNVLALPPNVAANGFYTRDVLDSWLVKVDDCGGTQLVSYKALVPNTPSATSLCEFGFGPASLPWPAPAGTAVNSLVCGSVRAGLNVAPAVAQDGTIYTAARLHGNDRFSYLIAVKPNLTTKWVASLRDRLTDGCGVPMADGGTLPANGTPGGCRAGAALGVEPQTARRGDGRVSDSGSSSPTLAPDGSVYLGTFTRYNYFQGHLMHFDSKGKYLNAYKFGWDITPAIHEHGSTYSIVIKDNHYNGGSYCNDPVFCPPDRNQNAPNDPEAYYITQLNPKLEIEWRFKGTNTQSCQRNPDGTISCVSDHPNSFEWCMNAPALDKKGVVYANSEDGWLYAIEQGGGLKERVFQQLALGAAYTPTSLGPDGKVYSQNAGHLFVMGR